MPLKDRIHNFKVGDIHPFVFQKHVQLEDEEWYIFRWNDFKFMLPSGLYKDYGFHTGDTIHCRIDKINCSGKIFIEPEHPLYRDKTYLNLKFLHNEVQQNMLDQDVHKAIASDAFGKPHSLPNCIVPEALLGTNKTLKIKRIRKGKVHFDIPVFLQQKNIIRTGNRYVFKIGETRNIRKRKMIILVDPFQKIHGIDWHLYSKYALKENAYVECQVIRFNSRDMFVLEPKHPVYMPEMTYSFDYRISEKGDGHVLIEVLDCFFNKVEFIIPEAEFEKKSDNGKILLKVQDIRKGVPVF